MISQKEKLLLAIALYWRKQYYDATSSTIATVLEYLLDEISKEAELSLNAKERNDVITEYCTRFQKTI